MNLTEAFQKSQDLCAITKQKKMSSMYYLKNVISDAKGLASADKICVIKRFLKKIGNTWSACTSHGNASFLKIKFIHYPKIFVF